jgi:putative hydrolase of the HAD superfamily
MKKAILLDLDNTIYNYDIPHKKGLESAYKLLKTKLNLSKVKFFKLYNLARQEIHKELSGTASAHSRVLYFQRLIEKLHEDVKPELIVSLHDTYWNIFFKSMTLPKKTLNALKKLKEKGLKIAIVSDFTTLIQLKKLKTLKISQYIDFLVTSEEAGSEKPHAIMFLLALNKMDVAPSDALMVGDNEIADIEGANFVGMDTVLLSSKTNTNKVHSDDYREPNYTLKEFSHLVEVVDAMNLKMIQTEGYVKYNSVFKKTKPLKEDISELNSYRQRLYNKKISWCI